jgi:uncharacterized protein
MNVDLCLGLIFLVSAFTMSYTGFGYGMVSVPLLSLILPIQEAVILQFPHCMALFLYQAWHYRRHIVWNDMKPLITGTALGIAAGVLLLQYMPESLLKRALAVFIPIAVVFNLTPWGQHIAARHARNRWWGRFCGLLTGAFFGAYTIGGPTAVLYVSSITTNALKAKGLLAAFFTVQFIMIAIVYGWAGMFTWKEMGTSAIFAPVVALGSLAGFWAFSRTSNRLYRRATDVMLVAASLALWFSV